MRLEAHQLSISSRPPTQTTTAPAPSPLPTAAVAEDVDTTKTCSSPHMNISDLPASSDEDEESFGARSVFVATPGENVSSASQVSISPEVPIENYVFQPRPSSYTSNASKPTARPSRIPEIQLTPNRTRILTDDPKNPVRNRVFYHPDDPSRPSARYHNRTGPTRKEARSYLRECTVLITEHHELHAQVSDVRNLLRAARDRLAVAQKHLGEVRASRKTLEKLYMRRLKQDETLHNGSRDWEPLTEEEQAQTPKPMPTSWRRDDPYESEDSDPNQVVEGDESSSSPASSSSAGKRKREIDPEEVDRFISSALKRARR